MSPEAFVKAEVGNTITMGDRWSLTLSGLKLRTLLGFFPQLEKWNPSAGLWAAGTKVLLFRADGSTVRIYTNIEMDTWSRGAGEWPLKPGFADFIAEELKAQGQVGEGK